MNRDRHLVIVGAGPAGLATARAYWDGGGLGRVTMLTPEPYAPYMRPPLTKEYLRGDALEHGRIAGTVIAGSEAVWSRIPGFWSTIGDETIKYWAWEDGWDEQVFEDQGEAFTVWYGNEGELVGVLSHGIDEDYERGRGLIESGEPFSR